MPFVSMGRSVNGGEGFWRASGRAKEPIEGIPSSFNAARGGWKWSISEIPD